MIRNFLYRARDYIKQNRRRLIKAAVIIIALLITFLIVRALVERVQKARYEKRVEALEAQIGEANDRAREAERQAETLKAAIDDKYAQIRDLESRAKAAERNLRQTREIVAPLKETYEETRTNPDVPVDTTCADACKALAGLGHPCR